jgi:dynein heavy chain
MKSSATEGNRTLEDFKSDIRLYKGQQNDILKIQAQKDMGIIRIEASKLRDSFMPSTAKCLKEIEKLMPELALVKYKAISEEVTIANSKLREVPSEVHSFVDYLKFLHNALEHREELTERFEDLEAHYRLMEEERLHVEEMDKAQFLTLVPEFNSLKAVIEIADAAQDENIAKFSTDLEQLIAEFQTRTGAMKEVTSDEDLLTEVEDFAPRIEKLQDLQAQVAELQREARMFEEYQTLFGVPVSKYELLEEIVSDVNLKLDMWVSLRDSANIAQKWASTQFAELKIDEMTVQVQKWWKAAARCDRELPPNAVSPKLKKIAQTYKLTLPTVTELGNPNLKQRHWEKIYETIGQKINREDTENYTLGYLLDLNIMDYREAIEQISTEATQEAGLESYLLKVQNAWLETYFSVSQYKDPQQGYKEVYILGGIDDIFVQVSARSLPVR